MPFGPIGADGANDTFGNRKFCQKPAAALDETPSNASRTVRNTLRS
jgi:hypothetical protein